MGGWLGRTANGGTARLELSDGWQGAFWDCDAGLLKANTLHHLVVIVDGRVKGILFRVEEIAELRG